MRKPLLTLLPFVLTRAILADDPKPLVLRFDNPSERSMSSHRNGPWFPDSGKNTFGLSVAHVWGDKTYTGRLHYSFPTPGHDAVILAGPGVFVPTECTWACWPVYGDGSGHTIDLSVNDAGRENHYISPVDGNRITWKGWKVLWFDLRRRPMVGWSGNNAQILEPPLNAGSLVMCDAPESFVGEGDLWLGDMAFMTDEMKAEFERRAKEMEEASTQLDTIGKFRVGCPELSGFSLGNFNWESFQNQAAEIDTFVTMEGQKPKEPMRAWVAKSKGQLLVVCECETADIAKVAPPRRQRDENVYEDECVEVFLDPSRDGSKYYHFAVNSEGIVGDEVGGGNGLDRAWNCDVKALVRKGERSWSVALAIPLNAVGLTDATGETVGFNVCRENHIVAENLCWRPTFDGFHVPSRFGELVLGSGKVTLTGLALSGVSDNGLQLTATMRSAEPVGSISLEADIEGAEGKQAARLAQTSAAGSGTLSVKTPAPVPTEGESRLRLVIREGGQILYRSQWYALSFPEIGKRLVTVTQSLTATEAQLRDLGLTESALKPLAERLSHLRRFASEFDMRRKSPESVSYGDFERLSRDIDTVLADPAERLALVAQTYTHIKERNANMPALEYVLGVADSMQKVFRDDPYKGKAAEKLYVEAAKNEIEAVQLLIVPTTGKDIRFATLEITDLKGPKGTAIPKSRIEWNVVGYVALEKPRKTGEPFALDRYWPDPLLKQQYFHVKAEEVQPIWIKVKVPAETSAGTYKGTVTVRPAAQHEMKIPLEVKVWDFEMPKQQHLETSFPLRPGDLQTFYKLDHVPIELYEKWIDFCMKNRIAVNLNDWGNYAKDFERLVKFQLDRGGSAFCLDYAGFSSGTPQERKKNNEAVVARIKPLYEIAKRRGWLKRAYVYLNDEVGKEHYEFAKELYSSLKESFPGLRLMQTFYRDDPINGLGDVIDIWAPNTGRYNADEFRARQAKGDEVWWYVCCGPGKPFANLMINWQGIDHRMLSWQNWKLGVTGHLYWGLDWWSENLKREPRWPESEWDAASWRNDAGIAHHGDGYLLYPGPDLLPLSSVRFENLRDGIEDYEYFCLLRDNVEKLKKSGKGSKSLMVEAEKALSIDDGLCKDLTHFSENPGQLRAARAHVAEMIGKTGTALGLLSR